MLADCLKESVMGLSPFQMAIMHASALHQAPVVPPYLGKRLILFVRIVPRLHQLYNPEGQVGLLKMVGTYYPALRFLNMPIINGGHTFKEFYSKADGALKWVLTNEKQKMKDDKQSFNRHWTRKVPVATRFQRFMGMVNFLAVHCSQCPANSEGLKLCQTSGFSERLSGDESHPQISTKYFRQALESVIGGLLEGKIGSWVQLPDERAVASFFLGGKADRHNAARLITQLN